jgi:hypothetical protein
VVTGALALAVAAPTASAKPRCPKHAHVHGKKAKACKKAKKKATPKPFTPVTVTLLDGSTATLDLGGGVVRMAPLSGTIKGGIPGGYMLLKDNTFKLQSGLLSVGATDILTDDCTAPPVARTNPATRVTLKPSGAVVKTTGDVYSTAAVVLRTVLDLRSGGCGSEAVTGGYADTPLSVFLHGKIAKGTGLSALTLDSDPQVVTIAGCLAPGAPAAPCAAAPIGYPVTLTTHLVVKVAIG